MLLGLLGIDKRNPEDYPSALGKMMAHRDGQVCYRVIKLPNLPATFYLYPRGNWLKKF